MLTVVQSLREFSQLKLAAMAGTAVVLIGFFIFLSLRISSPVMSPLYTNLAPEDGAKIVEELEKKNIPYELRANGTQILIPSDNVSRMRLSMAEQGLPSSGTVTGYEIFDHSEALGTSNFVLNVNKLRALEGELSRTIMSFENIETARVHLVMPKRELFSRDKAEPTASVALKLKGGNPLGKEQVAAIRHLVATAVPGLKPQRITMVDQRGRLLAKGVDAEGDDEAYSEEADEFRSAYEKRMRSTVERLLEQSLGLGKVKAEVSAMIDFDKITTSSEKYDPEGQVVRSVQESEEQTQSNESSQNTDVTVGNQLPDANANNAGDKSSNVTSRTEGTTNYEISKEIVNHVKQKGTVERLSVAVLVDGTYAADKDGNQVYTPRTPEQLAQLENLVRSAIGYDEKRGDTVSVVNMQFADSGLAEAEEGALDFMKNDLDRIIQTLVLGGVAILAILLVIRPLVSRAIESAEAAKEEEAFAQAALGAPGSVARLTDQSARALGDGSEDEEEDLINIARIQGKVKSNSVRKINELIEKHPEETLQIIRQWAFNAA